MGILPSPTTEPTYLFQKGDLFWVKRIPAWNLEPVWKGPYPAVLLTPTTVKVAGVISWGKNPLRTMIWAITWALGPLKMRLIRFY